MSENQLKELPPTIGQLSRLTTLTMFKNRFSQLPAELAECSQLQSINFFDNRLIRLPPAMAKLHLLKDLNVGGNKLKTLPKVDEWVKLIELRTHKNTLVIVPSFEKLGSLKTLKLDSNKPLRTFPALGVHSELETIEASRCDLEQLPEGVFTASCLPAVNSISFQSNRLSRLV